MTDRMRGGPAGRRGRRRRAVVAAAAAGATSAVASGGSSANMMIDVTLAVHTSRAAAAPLLGGSDVTAALAWARDVPPRCPGEAERTRAVRKCGGSGGGWEGVGEGGRLSPRPLRWRGNVIVVVILLFPARGRRCLFAPNSPAGAASKIEIPRHNTIILRGLARPSRRLRSRILDRRAVHRMAGIVEGEGWFLGVWVRRG